MNIFNTIIWNISLKFTSPSDLTINFSSILEKINVKSRKNMLTTGVILFWTDRKRVFNWNMDNFKSNFLSQGQPGIKSIDKFFLSVLKMWPCYKYFLGNSIFTLTARTLSGNRLKISIPQLL